MNGGDRRVAGGERGSCSRPRAQLPGLAWGATGERVYAANGSAASLSPRVKREWAQPLGKSELQGAGGARSSTFIC